MPNQVTVGHNRGGAGIVCPLVRRILGVGEGNVGRNVKRIGQGYGGRVPVYDHRVAMRLFPQRQLPPRL